MPHKNKRDAQEMAKQVGIDQSQVTKSDAGYFIAPQGMTSKIAREVYAKNRAKGMSKEQAAKIAWSVQKRVDQ